MSFAILELRLHEPPASLERQGQQWRVRCERCGGHSKGFLRISHALTAQHRHGQVHVEAEAEDLTGLLDSWRRPVDVRPQVASLPYTGVKHRETTRPAGSLHDAFMDVAS